MFQISLTQHTPHIAMDATLRPTDAMPPVPAALPSDAPTPAAIVVGTLPLPHAAALPPTAVDASVHAPPAAAVGVLPDTAMLPPFLPTGTIPPMVSAPRGRGRGPGRGGGHGRGHSGRGSTTGRGGRQSGVRNYRNAILIDIIDDVRPIGNNGWELVAQRYLEASGEDDPREVKDLKAHWVNKLCNNFKKPTGRTGEAGGCINRCIEIEHQIQIQIQTDAAIYGALSGEEVRE